MRRKVIIIAEAGVNHNGSFENAKKLILAGAEAGVDYVKFQTFKANKLVSKDAKKADYQKINTKATNLKNETTNTPRFVSTKPEIMEVD
jgi:sialic acid synthase SpsE